LTTGGNCANIVGMYIPRLLEKPIINRIKTDKKAVIVYGPRQAGKTTLVNEIIKKLKLKTLFINADRREHTEILSSRDLTKIKSLISGFKLLVIDEAQRIPDIGINLKIMVDNLPDLRIVATGSSSFELANRIQESLTGRAWSYYLLPLSFEELIDYYSKFEISKERLEEIMIFGSYPEVFHYENAKQKQEYLAELIRSYLYKDVLEIATIKHSEKINQLLQLIAYQIGSEVSTSEISNTLGISREAVDRYIDLLEKSFVLFRLPGFSRNLRKEVSKMDKIFFYDLGVRNAIINDFKPIKIRPDKGGIWENFLILERKKYLNSNRLFFNNYYWRVHTGGEIDYLEEKNGKITGYEFKFNEKVSKPPPTWTKYYPEAEYHTINLNNYLQFISRF